ncbi:hypothetical protein [Sphingomonas melonis]|uniref:hypothetical protein n=1 Tax=Sphingomonas melonis TaxID=152682 RepID=UPI0012DE0F01|nr:hypothetical protein [Sphingomonas melonis]
MAKKLVGPGHAFIEDLREADRRRATALLRIETVGPIVNEIDALREVAASLATEVRAFRDNVQMERDAPPAPIQSCLDCISFNAVKSTEAHVKVERQAIVQQAGVCRHNPPTAMPRGAAGGSPTGSFFPPVWPHEWCRRWEPLQNRKVPKQ